METEVRACCADDIAHLRAAGTSAIDLRRLEQRWSMQQRDQAVCLLAWRGDRLVGQVTLLRRSKYDEVVAQIGPVPEMNALEANPRGNGIGTAIIARAEHEAEQLGAQLIGLAVEVGNTARRLYERLGYAEWPHGRVVDNWSESDETGAIIRSHADECFYLTKVLSGSRSLQSGP